MTNIQHTPTPWRAHEQPHDCRSGDGVDFSIMGGQDKLSVLLLVAAPGEPTPQFRADFAFAVHAANTHDDLVNALRAVELMFDGLATGDHDEEIIEREVRAALAKAGAKS